MAIFNSYVELPEGTYLIPSQVFQQSLPLQSHPCDVMLRDVKRQVMRPLPKVTAVDRKVNHSPMN